MTVFLYAGQGSQSVGMGADLYAAFPEYRKIADSAEFSYDPVKLMSEGPEERLNDTRYTQGCMAVFAAGVTEILKNRGITPDAACGLSLGEYGALYAAGVWNTKDYLKIVDFRGNAMADAAKGLEVSMSAVLGTDPENVRKACEETDGFVTISNYNCPGQYVICGEEASVAAAEKYLKENFKALCKRLKTSGPFHTKLLKQAGDDLAELFKTVDFGVPKIPVAMNVTGQLYEEGDDLKKLLEQQVQNSVRFEDDLKTLISMGADTFIEIGPGNVLSGLLRKTARAMGASVTVLSIQRAEDIVKAGAL